MGPILPLVQGPPVPEAKADEITSNLFLLEEASAMRSAKISRERPRITATTSLDVSDI